MNKKRYLTVLALVLCLFSCQVDRKARRDDFYKSGQGYLKQGKLDEAIIEFRNALQAEANHVPSHLALAEALRRKGDHAQARDTYLRVLELDGGNIEAKLELGSYHLLAGAGSPTHFTEARKLAESILEKDPKNIKARILLGNAYGGLNDLNRSIEEMRSVLAQDPENLTAGLNLGGYQLRLQDTASAEKTFLDTVSRHPNSPEARRALGAFFLVRRQPQKAEEQFQRAYDLAPQDAANMYSLLRFFLLAKGAERGEQFLQEAMKKTPDWTEPAWALSNLYVAQKKRSEGIALLVQLAEKSPSDRRFKSRLAEVYIGSKEWTNAGAILKQLLNDDPGDARAHYLQGLLLASSGKEDDAFKEYRKAIELDRNMAQAHKQLALLHLNRLDFTEAHKELNETLRLSPQDLQARGLLAKVFAMTGRPREALAEARIVLDQFPGSADALTARAESLLATGEIQEAEKEFLKLYQGHEDNPYLLHRLGRIETLKKNRPAATEYFRKALQIDPNLLDVIRDYLRLYTLEGDYKTAHALADEFLKTAKHPDVLHLFKGEMYFGEKKYAEAENEFRKAVAAEPKNYQAYLMLGQTQQAQNKTQEAIREVDQLISRDSQFAPAFMLKAYFMETSGDVKGAMAHYQKALDLAPENPAAANNLAWLYCQSGQNLEQALTLARKAREKDPDNGHIADTLGWIYYKMGNYTLAVDQLTFAVNHGQQKPEHYYRLGMALYGKGDRILAKQTLRKALELSNRFAGADEAARILREIG